MKKRGKRVYPEGQLLVRSRPGTAIQIALAVLRLIVKEGVFFESWLWFTHKFVVFPLRSTYTHPLSTRIDLSPNPGTSPCFLLNFTRIRCEPSVDIKLLLKHHTPGMITWDGTNEDRS